MTGALQLWVLAGAMVSGGIALLVWWLQPAQPDLAQVLARLAPGRAPAPGTAVTHPCVPRRHARTATRLRMERCGNESRPNR